MNGFPFSPCPGRWTTAARRGVAFLAAILTMPTPAHAVTDVACDTASPHP